MYKNKINTEKMSNNNATIPLEHNIMPIIVLNNIECLNLLKKYLNTDLEVYIRI